MQAGTVGVAEKAKADVCPTTSVAAWSIRTGAVNYQYVRAENGTTRTVTG